MSINRSLSFSRTSQSGRQPWLSIGVLAALFVGACADEGRDGPVVSPGRAEAGGNGGKGGNGGSGGKGGAIGSNQPVPPGNADGGDVGAPDAGGSGDTAAPPPSIVTGFMDRSKDPCADFFEYACGAFVAKNPTKDTSVGITYKARASTQASNFTRDLIDQKVKDAAAGSTDPEALTIANYYQSCLDAENQPASRTTLKGVVDMIDDIESLDDWAVVGAELRKRGVSTVLMLYPSVDPGASTAYLMTFDQGARKLPNRDYYFDPAFASIRSAYLLHIETLATLVGVDVDADAVLRVETSMAMTELTPALKRDPIAIYNKMPFAAAAALAPRVPLRAHLDALGYGPIEFVNVISPAALKGLDATFGALGIEDLKHYLRWQVIESKATLLDKAALVEEFNFHDRLFDGSTAMQPRRNECLSMTTSRFTNVLARSFVEKYFPDSLRAQSNTVLTSLRAAFARRLPTRMWLDEPTRKEAMVKLDAIVAKVGSEVNLPQITKVTAPMPLLEQNLAAGVAGYVGNVNVLKTMPDRTRWSTSALTVNAFYSHNNNDVTLPAAILQAPWFDPRRPPVANFAMMGSVMGHELSHAFDDRGRHYDATGNLRDWWTPRAVMEFSTRASCFGTAMGSFEALPGKTINAELTLGENLADNNGLRLAYDAYMYDGPHAERYEGFDERQQFFIAFAQLRCSNYKPEYITRLIATDPHPPENARVNVPVALMPEFAQAFNCPAGAKERAAMSCEMW